MALHPKDDIMLAAKVRGLVAMIRLMTGEDPAVRWTDDYAEIVLTDAQKKQAQGYIESALKSKKPGRIKIDLIGLALPVLLRVYGKGLLLGMVAAFFGGRAAADM